MSDHRKSHNHRVAIALSSTLALPFLNRPTHSPCHNLCIDLPPPANFASLLNLGFNYCLRAKRTISEAKFKSFLAERFTWDIYIKSCFIGQRPDPDAKPWTPKTLYIKLDDWDPDPAQVPIELKVISKFFLAKLRDAFFTNRNRTSVNLDPIQRHTLNILEKSTTHVVLPTDKNLGPAVIQRDTYVQAVLSLLQDRRTYQRLSPEDAQAQMCSLHSKYINFLDKYDFPLDNDESTYLRRSVEQSQDYFSHFYIIAKIHKYPWKLRPIVSYCGSLLYGLGKWLDQQIQPIARATAAYVASSFDLCEQLKDIRIDPSRDSLLTADANSMYTNIDTTHALEVFTWFFNHHPLCLPIRGRAKMILEALELLMRNNLFQFGDTFWKQEDGTAMGAPPAPAYATLYYSVHELDLLHRFGKFLKFYRRYIDDAFIVWRASPDSLEDSQQWTLFKTSAMNFGLLTWKVEARSKIVNFLDLTISIENERLVTKIFEKPQNLYLYLPSSSCHTPGILKGTIIGMIYRYFALITYESDFILQVELFFHRLCNRGYRPALLKPLFEEAITRAPTILANRRRPKPEYDPTVSQKICAVHVPYHPLHPTGNEIQAIFRASMLNTKHITPLPKIQCRLSWSKLGINQLRIVNHRARNIKDHLFPRKFAKLPGDPVSSYISAPDPPPL